MTILALDLATTTGWAFATKSGPISGAEKFSGEIGEFAFRLLSWLQAKIVQTAKIAGPIQCIAIEQPIVMSGQTTFATTCRLVGSYVVASMVSFDFNLPVFTAPPSQWRSYFIGTGRAPLDIKKSAKRKWLKTRTIEECRSRGWAVSSDDAADAMGLLSYALHRSTGDGDAKA